MQQIFGSQISLLAAPICPGFDGFGHVAWLPGLSVRVVNDVYLLLRRHLPQLWPVPVELGGALELDESYFGPRRVRGKRGRGAGSNFCQVRKLVLKIFALVGILIASKRIYTLSSPIALYQKE
ncbi:MAG: hypothetical protein EOO60_02750 [Hymenobacter sp.]|nr:MAG: hypothetical protein EOO60_02750 [Hymenobacter sp.]